MSTSNTEIIGIDLLSIGIDLLSVFFLLSNKQIYSVDLLCDKFI